METGLKEKLFLFCINQEKGIIRQRQNLSTLLFYASLLELARKGVLKIEDGRWYFQQQDTGDPVLNEVIRILMPRDGQKTSWVLGRTPFQITRLFTRQVEWMKATKLVQVREVTFLGLKLGYRFRISKPDQMKPDLLKFERVLIYGRPPDLNTHLLIILFGISEQIKHLFPSSENKRRAQERFKELSKLPPEENPEAYTLIFKKLQEALRAKRAARS
ncbi:MAG: GPP34 family phosphoprotein [Bacteroidales bacterium]|nr:GPP34 family phosphoprotein [Bacteroidales bacterium]